MIVTVQALVGTAATEQQGGRGDAFISGVLRVQSPHFFPGRSCPRACWVTRRSCPRRFALEDYFGGGIDATAGLLVFLASFDVAERARARSYDSS